MLNTEFTAHGASGPDLYPEALRGEIDRVNEAVYRHINNGVYRCGFARSQEAYEEAFGGMFETWDMLEALLERHRYLVGHGITEADVRLFPTLVRFDPVYYSHFKCNLRRIADYPNLSNYLRDQYQLPQFGSTVNIEQYKRGYYGNSPRLNPSGIIPLGPELHLDAPHDRATRAYSG
ncbi:MAG: glutathione S-transferase C-terminal domain-containing protein [bacterium]